MQLSKSKILVRLKNETKELHHAVEKISGVNKILEGTLTKNEYFNILQKNYAAYYFVEQQIIEFSSYKYFKKATLFPSISSWIKQDLNIANGETLSRADKPIIKFDNYLMAIGATYVLEGSLLGGAFIANHIEKCENIKKLPPQFFYKKASGERIKRWKILTSYLSSKEYTNDEMDTIVDGAKRAFLIFMHYYQQSTD